MRDLGHSPTSRGVGKKLEVRGEESKESTTNSDKSYVRCKRCGFLCNTAKVSACPLCGIQNYWRKNNP